MIMIKIVAIALGLCVIALLIDLIKMEWDERRTYKKGGIDGRALK